MKKKISTFILFLFLLFLSSCSYFSDIEPADKIILITLDTTRADHLGCYGYQNIETPNLDQIALDGILFKNAICHVPTTLPSHSSIMTGLYPIKHGVRSNLIYHLPESSFTLAEILKENGYETAAIISTVILAKRYGIAQGFDYFDESFLEEFMDQPELIKQRRAKGSIDLALKWLEERKDKKFFLWLHLYDPHTPYDPPPPFYEKYRDRLYDGEIAYMDDALGHFFDQLKEWNIFNDSLILIIGDHGEGLGEHGEYEHQFLIYESNVRVPLIIHDSLIERNGIVEDVVAAVDVFQTILDVCHIKKKYQNDGRSLMPYMNNPLERLEKRSCYIESLSGDIDFGWSPLYGLREDEWKYIEAPEEELYNVLEDPDEKNNLATYETEIMERMSEKLELIKLKASEEYQEQDTELELSEEEQMKLASLGYVGMTRSRVNPEKPYRDPKDFIFIERDFLMAIRLQLAGKHDTALSLFKKVLDADPENKSALLNSGKSYFEIGEIEKSQMFYEKFISIYPDLLQGYDKLVKIYINLKEWNKLKDFLMNSLPYLKEDSKTQNILFLSILQDAGCDHLIEILSEVIKVEKEMASLYFFLSKCHAIKRENEPALRYLDSALEKDSKNLYINYAMYDEAFQNLREKDAFKKIISKYREKKKDERAE